MEVWKKIFSFHVDFFRGVLGYSHLSTGAWTSNSIMKHFGRPDLTIKSWDFLGRLMEKTPMISVCFCFKTRQNLGPLLNVEHF